MNEVAGGSPCPLCSTFNAPVAVECSGCGAALGRTMEAQPYSPPPPSPYEHYSRPTSPLEPYPTTYQQHPSPVAYAPAYAQPHGQAYYPQPYPPQMPGPHGMPQPYPPQPYPPQAPGPYAMAQPGVYHPYPGMPPININVSPVVNVHMPAPQPAPAPMVIVNTTDTTPHAVVRALWFIFVGLWLGLISTVVGWVLCIGMITLPLGLMILNRLPAIMTLRPASRSTQVFFGPGVTVVNTNVVAEQHPMWLRALYFVFVGSWLSAIWLVVAWCLVALTPITLGMSLALAFMMFEQVPQILTLRVN